MVPPKLFTPLLKLPLPVTCIGALENEAKPIQVWATAGDRTIASRASETTRLRRMKVSDVDCGRTLLVEVDCQRSATGRRLRTRPGRCRKRERLFRME